MSSRNRGRASHNNQDADEERRLWSEIKGRAKDVDAMVVGLLSVFFFTFHLAMVAPCRQPVTSMNTTSVDVHVFTQRDFFDFP